MDETNLLNLIKPWLDNIYQITTKSATVPFCKKIPDLNRPLLSKQTLRQWQMQTELSQLTGKLSVLSEPQYLSAARS
jgi:hypothetical protein